MVVAVGEGVDVCVELRDGTGAPVDEGLASVDSDAVGDAVNVGDDVTDAVPVEDHVVDAVPVLVAVGVAVDVTLGVGVMDMEVDGVAVFTVDDGVAEGDAPTERVAVGVTEAVFEGVAVAVSADADAVAVSDPVSKADREGDDVLVLETDGLVELELDSVVRALPDARALLDGL